MAKKKKEWEAEERRLAKYYVTRLLQVVKGVWVEQAVQRAVARWKRNERVVSIRLDWSHLIGRWHHSRHFHKTQTKKSSVVADARRLSDDITQKEEEYEDAKREFDNAVIKFRWKPKWIIREAYPKGLTWNTVMASWNTEWVSAVRVRRLNLRLLVVVAVCVSLHAVSENYEHTCEHQVWGDKYCMYGGTSKSYRKKELRVYDLWSETTRIEMRALMGKWRNIEKQRELMGKNWRN